MADDTNVTESPSAEEGWKRSPVVFGLSMLAAGALGAIGATAWLDKTIAAKVEAHLEDPMTRAAFKGEKGSQGEDGVAGISPTAAEIAATLMDEQSGAISAALEPIATTAAENAVSAQLPAGGVAGVPDGVVVATWHRCSDLGDGWSDFHHGQGRMIVGAGDPANNPYGDNLTQRMAWGPRMATPPKATVGGSEKVTLTENHMRAHQHAMFSNGSGANTDVRPDQTVAHKGYRRETGIDDVNVQYRLVGAGGSPNVGATSIYGKTEAFSVMPPYIALYFCKKD